MIVVCPFRSLPFFFLLLEGVVSIKVINKKRRSGTEGEGGHSSAKTTKPHWRDRCPNYLHTWYMVHGTQYTCMYLCCADEASIVSRGTVYSPCHTKNLGTHYLSSSPFPTLLLLLVSCGFGGFVGNCEEMTGWWWWLSHIPLTITINSFSELKFHGFLYVMYMGLKRSRVKLTKSVKVKNPYGFLLFHCMYLKYWQSEQNPSLIKLL